MQNVNKKKYNLICRNVSHLYYKLQLQFKQRRKAQQVEPKVD